MINIDVKLFDRLSNLLQEKYTNISVYGEYIHAPATFPHVSIIEADNYTDTNSLPLSCIPVASILMYEINVYSNKLDGRKTECNEIISLIDDEMADMGFVRTLKNPVSNLENASIYRIVARYRKLQPKGGNL